VSSWARLEERRAPWGGAWCGVYLSRPGRAGRSSARQRQRALDFLGLRELEPGLWVRPDNLVGGVAGLRTELRALGLDARSRVFALGDLDPETDARARGLWDTRALDAAYSAQLRRLQRSGRALAKRKQAAAVVESFLVGGVAINLLAFDPLLPDEILPGGQRRALVEAMRRYDRLGRACWRDFAKQQGVPGIVLPRERSVDAAGTTPTGG
jgi:phenylacetic acid degradation operon negative regulatory protein